MTRAETVFELLLRNYARTHHRALEVIDDLSEAQFHASAAPTLHSVAWQLWHMARWTDVLASELVRNEPGLLKRVGASGQIWVRDDLATTWGLPAGEMGRRDAGTGLSDEVADGLVLPERPVVRDYALRVFAFAEAVFGAVENGRLLEPAPDDPDGDSYGRTSSSTLTTIAATSDDRGNPRRARLARERN